MALKVRVDVPDRYKDRIQGIYDVAGLLADIDVALTFSPDPADEDVLFTHERLEIIRRAEGRPSKVPLVIFERTASGVVSHSREVRNLLKAPQTKSWIKEMALRDQSLNNAPALDGRVHFRLLEPNSDRIAPPSVLLNDADNAKVRPLLPMFVQPRYAEFRDQPVIPWKKRPIDILIAGTVRYDDIHNVPVLDRHREKALQLVCGTSLKFVAIAGQIVPKATYAELLRNSKMLLSPYGLGEYSFKDFEAAYAGCTILKSDSSYVQTYAFDIYSEGRYCLQMKPDMSDFPDMIQRFADDPQSARAVADAAAEAVRTSFKPEEYAGLLKDVFLQAAQAPGA